MARTSKKKQPKPVFNEITAAGGTTMGVAFSDRSMESNARNIKSWRGLLRDHQVGSVWEQRQAGVIAVDWEVYPASEAANDVAAAEFIKDQISKVGFDQVTKKMHFAQFYGFAIAECMWAKDGSRIVLDKIVVRAQERFTWKGGELLFTGGGNSQGDPLPDFKMWHYTLPGDSDDVPHGPCLGWRLYWPVFLKENGARFWAVFIEKYGMPTSKGEHPTHATQEEIDNLLATLMAVHSQSAVAVPEGFKLELLQAMRSSGGDYEKFQEYWDKAVSKVILSQTMTTDDGSSQSQANVHERVADNIIQGDADLICDSFNRGPIAWLTAWNFPGANPPEVWRRIAQEEDLDKRADRDKKVSEASGLRPTKAYVEDVYGGEWEETNAQEKRQPKDPAFADRDDEADDVDELADQLDDLSSADFADILDEIRQTLKDSQSLEDAQSRLLSLSSKIKTNEMAKKVAGGLAVADLMGRASVDT